jgi:hypothetical protein
MIHPSRSALAGLLLAGTVRAQPPGLPLQVLNPSSAPMVQAPVSFGVPFPGKGVTFTDIAAANLCVLDWSGAVIPHQFKVLSRWHGDRSDSTKAVKWALVTFLADCPAGGNATYVLGIGYPRGGQISVQTTPSTHYVSTRPGTTFAISRQAFSLFDHVTVDGAVAVAQPGSLVLTDPGGVPITATVTDTIFEEWGSVRLVLAVKGTLSNDLSFTCRYTFHSGQSEAQVDFRLENPGPYGVFFNAPSQHRYFDKLYFRLPVQGSGTQVVSHGGPKGVAGTTYELTQDCAPIPAGSYSFNSFIYQERIGSTLVNQGGVSPVVLDVPGSSAGVSICVEKGWQNFPKTLRFENQAVLVGLWPEWGHGPEYRGIYGSDPIDPMALANYRFEGGRWKTHRMVFDFHGPAPRTGAELVTFASRVNSPPMGRPLPLWTKRSGAIPVIFNETRTWNSPGLDRMELLHTSIVDDSAATNQPGLGRIGLNEFRLRGGTYNGKQFFGWCDFGDIKWGEGYSSLHYDWTSSMLLDFYRGGPYMAYDFGREMAWHRRDYDQNHTEVSTDFWRGGQFYEKGDTHGNYRFGEPSHNWVHGVLLHYVMTGEEGSREAAIQNLNYCLRNTPANWNGAYGIRIPGWTLDNLVDGYCYLGNPVYLQQAGLGLAHIRAFEQQAGGLGYLNAYSITNPSNPGYATPWMHNIFFIAATKYVMVSGDTSCVDLLDRMRMWFRQMIVPASGTRSACLLPKVYDTYYANGSGTSTYSQHLIWPMMEAMAYAFALFDDPVDWGYAAGLFEIQTRFHQAPGGSIKNLDDPNQWSAASMRLTQYPGTESKIVGNMLRWSYAVPALHALLTGSW